MRKILFVFIYVLVIFTPSCTEKNAEIQQLIDEGIFESTNATFKTIDGSGEYIQKYKLTDDEIKIIGAWGFDIYTKSILRDDYGPGIGIIFLPNRLFYILKNGSNVNGIKYIIGEWKIENKLLLVKFNSRIVSVKTIQSKEEGNFTIEKKDSLRYYEIFKIPDYQLAYVNDNSFYWNTIPIDILKYYDINLEDKPRFRILFDTLGTPPGDISINSYWGNILFNRINNDTYFLKIVEIW